MIVAAVLLTGLMVPEHTVMIGEIEFPVAYWFFVIFNGIYWLGSGVMIPTALAMIADISEIHQCRTGELKDGSYSAFYSFVFKAAISFALLVSGFVLSGIGFDASVKEHSQDVIWRLGAAMLVVGPMVCVVASVVICKYKVSRSFLEDLRAQKGGC
jgi:GPH family glycoside/pentoside/hexuronide:cation symporter